MAARRETAHQWYVTRYDVNTMLPAVPVGTGGVTPLKSP